MTVFVTVVFVMSGILVSAQTYSLSGKVYDRLDSLNQPLVGALVHYNQGRSTAVSDVNGNFTVDVSPGEGELHIFHPEFESKISVFNTEHINNRIHVNMERRFPPVRPLIPGDTIPDFLWNLPLQVVNHPEGLDTVRLSDYADTTLLVLDLWSRGCKPCIESVDKMEQVIKAYKDNVSLLTVHNDVSERALPFITQRGWKSPAVVGINRKLVTSSFFVVDNVLGGMIYIQNRKVLAITFGSANNPNIELLHRKFKDGKRLYLYSTVDRYNYQGNLELYFHRLKEFEIANSLFD